MDIFQQVTTSGDGSIPECYQCGTVAHLDHRSRCRECNEGWLRAHYKVIVAGGRKFSGAARMAEKLDTYLANHMGDAMILSGGAIGADRMGESYAHKRELECIRIPAPWDELGKSAGYVRNDFMAQHADACIVFWDGKSRGTKHMIDCSIKRRIPLRVITY